MQYAGLGLLRDVLLTTGEPLAEPISFLQAILLGLVEGITEFLPVSSTGHLIVADALMGRSDPAFTIAIQVGAITAILVLFWRRLWDAACRLGSSDSDEGVNLIWLLLAASIPAIAVGLLFGDAIKSLLFNPITVASTLVVGGIALLGLEALLDRRKTQGKKTDGEISKMSWRDALVVGLFQCLALIPGTSRSGATIAGAMLIGQRRGDAAQFSFLLGLPILYGAAGKTLIDDWHKLSGEQLPGLLIATLAAFISALIIVGPFVRFVQRHSFRPFAWYRILAGGTLFALIGAGVVA